MSEIIVRFPDFPDFPELSNEANAPGYWLVDLPNWWDGVESRNESETRPDGDGEFDQDPIYSAARFPIVIGRVAFDSEGDLFAARRPIARLGAHRGPFTIEVESLDGVQRATVVRNGKVSWDMSLAPFRVEFEIPLKAADPRKYGPLRTDSTGLPVAGGGVESPVASPFVQIGGGSAGRVTLQNSGTTDTIPLLRVSGGGMTDGVEILRIETGQLIRLEWPILASDVVEFDAGTGQVWLNGQSPIAGSLTKAQWWTLGPGETTTLQFASLGVVTGTPILTAEWRDADS